MAFVEFEQRGHVGLITINRPEVLNALNLEVIEQLDDILLRAESQEDVHVIVITGAGRQSPWLLSLCPYFFAAFSIAVLFAS